MDIYVNEVDSLHPETRAMIQCFYSRSTMSIKDRIATLGENEDKIRENLKKYYVNYGHASIAECASITVFFEGVSMLAAKAIQDNPLYVGQESSTRYIDYSKQDFVYPKDSEFQIFYEFWSNRWREFYLKALPATIDHLKSQYPGEGNVYEKTIKARAFDVLRGYLPAGFATNVAWTGSFRTIGEHLRKLLNHPLLELRELAASTYEKLKDVYKNSFREIRETDYFKNEHFYMLSTSSTAKPEFSVKLEDTLPKYNKNNPIFKLVKISSNFAMDFGSWRDLQRHRNMVYFMPILSTKIGVEPFYVNNLAPEVQEEAKNLLAEFCFSIDKIEDSLYNKQYITPMGFLCDVMCSFDIHQAVYLSELRSQKTVHPTLRTWAQDLGRFLQKDLDIAANVDYDEESFTLKRGTQDIVNKEND